MLRTHYRVLDEACTREDACGSEANPDIRERLKENDRKLGCGLAAENAALGIFVMQLGAADLGRASHSQMNLGGGQHADYRCGEIAPKIGPCRTGTGEAKLPSGFILMSEIGASR